MKRNIVIILLGAILILAGIVTFNILFTRSIPEYSDPTIPIEVRVGRDFVIALESNPTTGYSWQLAKPLDEGILKLVSSEYKVPETKLVGKGGKELWTFRASGRGKIIISLNYIRPWEKDVLPVKRQTFVGVVH